MSAYNPPRENVPIFDASLFSTENDDTLTRQVANSSFLQFPIAQGTETLKDIIVEGTASFTNVAPPTSTATQPASNDSSTKMPTTAWVQGAITDTTKTFTGINTFSQNPLNTATQPASNDSSTIIPSTAWVQGAITANLGSVGTTISVDFPSLALTTTGTTFTPQNLFIPTAGTYLISGFYQITEQTGLGGTASCESAFFTFEDGSFGYSSTGGMALNMVAGTSSFWRIIIPISNVVVFPTSLTYPYSMVGRITLFLNTKPFLGQGRISAIRLL
jgi:hypothetical protein